MELKTSIQEAINYLGKEFFDNLSIAYHESQDKNLLSVKRHGSFVEIHYGSLSYLFRGLTLIKEKINETSYSIDYHTKFQTNGLMLDCSRNGVMKNEKVKEMILISALMGHNRLLLYTEDTFQLDKYPYFGYLRGGYTKEDIKEFVEYGESFGVELVPCIQTLGHLRQTLKWTPMAELKDGQDTLLIDSPKVYEFIDEMIKFSRECFRSKDIHIGMDESFEMGLHRHLRLFGYQDRVAMFSRHLIKVIEICQKYDFSPMIWSDMYFRLNNENDEYYRDTPLPKETLNAIPTNVKLVYWDYYHEYKEDYLRMIQYHKDTNNPIVFAGGSWRWMGFAPAIKRSIDYTKSALEACIDENIKDIFITAWGDDGNECSFFTIIPTLAEASIMNFGNFSLENIDSLTKAISRDNLKDFFLLDLPNLILDKTMEAHYNPSKYFLYQDILLGIFDLQVKECFSLKYRDFADILHKKHSEKYAYIYENIASLLDVLAIKCDLGVRLRKAYRKKDIKGLNKIIEDIDLLLIKFDIFQKNFKRQWMIECRPFGYEVIDGRLGFLKNRIITARKRIDDYLKGNINFIEELEKDVLPFDGREDEVTWGYWRRIVSPAN